MPDATAHDMLERMVTLVKRWWLLTATPTCMPGSAHEPQSPLTVLNHKTPVAFVAGEFGIIKMVDDVLGVTKVDPRWQDDFRFWIRRGESIVKALERGIERRGPECSSCPGDCIPPCRFFRDMMEGIHDLYQMFRAEEVPWSIPNFDIDNNLSWEHSNGKIIWFAEMNACQSETQTRDHLQQMVDWLKEHAKKTEGNDIYDILNRSPPLTAKDPRLGGAELLKVIQSVGYLATSHKGLTTNGFCSNVVWAMDEMKNIDEGPTTLGAIIRFELYELPRKPQEVTDESVKKYIKMMLYLYDQYGGGSSCPIFEGIPKPTDDELQEATRIIVNTPRGSSGGSLPPGAPLVRRLRSWAPFKFMFSSSTCDAEAVALKLVCETTPSYSMPTVIRSNCEWFLRISCPILWFSSYYEYIPVRIVYYSRQATILRGPGESFVLKAFADDESFNREVECLRQLEGLQGFPRLLACASSPYGSPCTILSYVGEPVSSLTQDEARKVNESIVKPMHARGVHHHDLVSGNITKDKGGAFYLIDFGEGEVVAEGRICRLGGECPDEAWAEELWLVDPTGP